MSIGENIRLLREERGIKQQEIADLIGMHRSNYSKIESGQREISVQALDKVARFFETTIDALVHPANQIPTEVKVEDKTLLEKIKLIDELEEDDRTMVFKMIDTCLTKKKFKDFFEEQLATA